MKVFLSPLAEYKLTKLLDYLEKELGKPSKDKFFIELEEKVTKFPVSPRVPHKQRILVTYTGV